MSNSLAGSKYGNVERFFIWYNNDDVLPFLEAIHNMSDYFKVRSLDLFKDAISLPGLAMKDLFKDIGTFFSLPKAKDADIHSLMKQNLVGGQ